jgi:hypothetical protein
MGVRLSHTQPYSLVLAHTFSRSFTCSLTSCTDDGYDSDGYEGNNGSMHRRSGDGWGGGARDSGFEEALDGERLPARMVVQFLRKRVQVSMDD